MYGKYKHTYHFASEDATYSEYSWKVIEDDGVYREVKIDKKVKDVNREIGRMGQIDEEQILYYEVDNDGFLIGGASLKEAFRTITTIVNS